MAASVNNLKANGNPGGPGWAQKMVLDSRPMPLVDIKARQAYFKQYHATWYAKNRKKVIAQVNVLKAKRRKEWQEYKATLACTKCGASHPAIMDFHHVDRSEPKHSVNLLISHGRWSKALEEIKKCVALCANCHRILHWEEKQAIKAAKAAKAKATKAKTVKTVKLKKLKKP